VQVLGKIDDERALPALEQALAEGMNTGGPHNRHPSVEVDLRDTIQDAILSIRTRQREQAQAAEPTPTESEHQTHD
jgi:hypothetical protein